MHDPARRLGLVALLSVALLAGCGVKPPLNPNNRLPAATQTALAEAGKWELISLNPDDSKYRLEGYRGGFHGFDILGKMEISDPALQKQLHDSLQSGVSHAPTMAAACFFPRHGIRVIHEGQTHDLLVCFECVHIRVYVNDAEVEGCSVAGFPESLFTQTLRQKGVPLPKPAD